MTFNAPFVLGMKIIEFVQFYIGTTHESGHRTVEKTTLLSFLTIIQMLQNCKLLCSKHIVPDTVIVYSK